MERRRRKDWVVRLVSVVSVLGWVFAFAALLLFNEAQPSGPDFFTRFLGATVINYLDVNKLNMAFIALLISFFVCAAGMTANILRHRRKTDRYNKSIIILGSVSLVGIIAFLINFT